MKKLLLLLSVLMLCFCACKDKHDYTPAYLVFTEDAFDDCFNVSTYNIDHNEQITDEDKLRVMGQHKFTHVYVAYQGKTLGVWELPCEIPILDVNENDSSYLNIVPCFKKNGLSSTIKGYGYVKSYKKNMLLKKGQTVVIDKESLHNFYEYHKEASFKLIEPFTSQNSFSPYNPLVSVATFNCVTDPDDASNRIGIINLTTDSLHQSFEVTTSEITLDIHYQTYLELRYKCDNDLNVEIYAPNYFNVYPCGGLFATDKWTTVYMNLDEHLANIYSTGTVFPGSIKVKVLLSGSRLEGQDTRYYVDYAKIITGPQP
jgi:hypothetical protein